MSESKASQIAREGMKQGNNCCQSVLLAAQQVWNIPVGSDLLAAAGLFGRGMGSGCSCGALTGMMMAAGVMDKYHPHPLGSHLPQLLHDEFKQEFGATCCRAIRKKHSALQNIGNKACMDLTGRTAEILIARWEGVLDAQPDPAADIHHRSDSE